MAAEKRKRARAGEQVRKGAGKRSLNLSVSADHKMRFKAFALMSAREPGELFMEWVDLHTKGMRFSLPGAVSGPEGDHSPGRGGEGFEGQEPGPNLRRVG